MWKAFAATILAILLASCSVQTNQPICNRPYILVGNSCCLDKDDTSICDTDERIINTNDSIVCNKPYIVVGNECCLDNTNNYICDKDESTQETNSQPQRQFTIEDLQADIGNVLDRTVILTKDESAQKFSIYSDKRDTSKFLGKYADTPYSKITVKKRQKVVKINDEKLFIDNKEKFEDFIKSNKNLFIESALYSKNLFESEFKEGDLLTNLFTKNLGSSGKAKYASHSEVFSTTYHDSLNFPEIVSGNIADINFVRVNKYLLNFTIGARRFTERLSNVNYGQGIVILCNKDLVISINFEDYGDGTLATYERGFDRSDVTKEYFLTSLRDHYNELITDAQAIIKMCEQRYGFTYIRYR